MTKRDGARLLKSGDRIVDAESAELFVLIDAVRSAMQAELEDLCAEGGSLRLAVRGEVQAALEGWGGPRAGGALEPVPLLCSGGLWDGEGSERSVPTAGWDAEEVPEGPSERDSGAAQGSSILSAFTRDVRNYQHTFGGSASHVNEAPSLAILSRLESLQTWLQSLREPRRKGCFSRFVRGSVFEMIVCLVIFLNCVFTVYETNRQMQNPIEASLLTCAAEFASDSGCAIYLTSIMFQVIYTLELVMKLIVHRWWFFFNASWKTNIFELCLVISGFVYLGLGSSDGPWILRMLRLARLGQGIRFIRILSHMDHLRALLICIQGCLLSLFWSLVMLFIVHGIFALFLMQSVSAHLQGTGESLEESIFEQFFGTVEASVLTLYMASTGGEDWGVAYRVVQSTGKFGSAMFLFFLAFVQFALINIITGIFVDTATKTLMKDSVLLAQEHSHQEAQHFDKLAQLCHQADEDCNGRLGPREFKNALRKNDVPTLLKMLGFQRHHVCEFFNHMAHESDDNEVDINDFIKGCTLMKGYATTFDLHKLYARVTNVQKDLDERLGEILRLLHNV